MNDLEETVIACVAEASGLDPSRISLDSDLVLELGIGGDDGADLIADLRQMTGAQLTSCDFYEHLGPESTFTFHKPKPLTVGQLVQLIRDELGS